MSAAAKLMRARRGEGLEALRGAATTERKKKIASRLIGRETVTFCVRLSHLPLPPDQDMALDSWQARDLLAILTVR